MTVLVKFVQTGSFHAGEFKSLDLGMISGFRITRQRTSCELEATTPENPRPETPYVLARRDREYEIQAILADLLRLKQERKESVYTITETGACLVTD